MSKLHAVREDVKLRIAEVRDDVMKEPTLSIGEKKEVQCTRQLPYSPVHLLLLLHYMLSCLAPITLCHASSCCSTVHLCLSFWWIWIPEALEIVLTALPANFPVPIAIVQHMPPFFTKQLSRRLGEKCAIRVREAQSGETLEPGTALIAPGDFHLQVRRRDTRCYAITSAGPPENSCRPAADVLFRSAAEEFGNQALAVVMTGMGQDGLKGCEALHKAGGRVVIQDEATSIIWGMAGSVSRAGFASKELPIDKIAADLLRRAHEGRL